MTRTTRFGRRVVFESELTLRQYCALMNPPLYRPADLVLKSGLPQPRISEVLRGRRIYPAGMRKLQKALGVSPRHLERMVDNAAREREKRATA